MSEKQPLLQVKNLKQYFKVNSGYTVRAVDGVSFCAHRGEILCFAGVEGNGQQQVVECLAAQNKRYDGTICLLGQDIRRLGVRQVRHLGVSHIPEDRMKTGSDQKASIFDNLISICFETESRLFFSFQA